MLGIFTPHFWTLLIFIFPSSLTEVKNPTSPGSKALVWLLPSVTVALFYGWLFISDWILFGVFGIRGRPLFSDLNFTVNQAACAQLWNLSLYSPSVTDSNACPSGFLYGYSTILLYKSISNLGVGISVIGFTQCMFLLLFFSMLLLRSNSTISISNILLFLLVLTSPGVLLLVERGNIDGLVFILLCCGTYFASNQKWNMALIFLLLGASIKFYLLPAFIFFLILAKKKFWLLLSPILILLILLNWQLVKAEFPRNWFMSFGANMPIVIFERVLSTEFRHFGLISLFLGFALLVASIYFWTSDSNHRWPLSIPPVRPTPDFLTLLYVASTITWLFCFLFASNYDYRLIFLIAAAISGQNIFMHNRHLRVFHFQTIVVQYFSSAFFLPKYAVRTFHALGDFYFYPVAFIAIGVVIQLSRSLGHKQ